MSNYLVDLSVVVPVFNEEMCLNELYQRLTRVLDGMKLVYEIVLVDDGSIDASWNLIRQLSGADAHVTAVRLSRNFGHHIAISAGLDHSRGRWVVTMDADLQDLPEEIPNLYAKAMGGCDVVLARRKGRQHGVVKRKLGTLFAKVMSRLSEMEYDPEVGVFRIMSRRVVDEVCGLRETSRFFSGLVYWVGFTQGSVDVEHGMRYAGETKYPLYKQLSLAFDGIISFTEKPLKLAVYLGVMFALSGVGYALLVIVQALAGEIEVLGYASLLSAILIVGGVTIITVGVVGLYVGRIFRQVKSRPLYIVSETNSLAGAAQCDVPEA